MSKRDLLDFKGLTIKEIEALIDRALYFKKNKFTEHESHLLRGKSIGLFFEKPSTRTRVAFEAAIVRLGGHPIFLTPDNTQTNRGETIADTARVLSSYLHAIVIRTFEQTRVVEWAKSATIPVINGLSDLCHPCQILADFLTIFERRGHLRGLNLTYIGDDNNIAYSLKEGGAIVGMNVTIVSPKDSAPSQGNLLNIKKAATDADILYTDTWVSMGREHEEMRDNMLKAMFHDYQINQQIVDYAKPDCLVMHCLPAHRGEEITDAVMNGKNSVIFEQAANRLPMHQAILELALRGSSCDSPSSGLQ